jgi:hypothetical protein
VRIEKRWSFGTDAYLALVIEGFNVTTFKEALECTPSVALVLDPVPVEVVQGAPVDACAIKRAPALTIPSIGLEGAF